MVREIGGTAGEIWKHLEKNGEMTTLKLKSAMGITNAVLYLALGWLAREGKLNISEYAKNNYKVSLKK